MREVGAGAAVVFLHGSPATSDLFLPIANALADRYRSLIVDLPGYRGVPDHEQYSALLDVRRSLEVELERRSAVRLVLVGLSLGAWRALDLALSSRLDVVGVICLGGFGALAPEHASGLRQLAQTFRAMTSLDTPELLTMARATFLSPLAQNDPVQVDAVRACLRAAAPRTVAREFEEIVCAPALSDLEKLRCPLLARVGALDASTPPDYSRELARRAPMGRLELVPEKGHLLPLEDPEGTTASIRAALGAWFGTGA